jgi:hypothetical protein
LKLLNREKKEEKVKWNLPYKTQNFWSKLSIEN